MSSFEFLSVLISVVVGLGIANILNGVGRLVHRSGDVTVPAMFVAWTLYLFFYMIIYWWTVVFGWQDWQNWNLVFFMFVLAYGVILFLLSVILFPSDMPDDWNPGVHFIVMRRWYFGVFIVLVVVEYTDSMLKGHLADFSVTYQLMMLTWLIGGIVGWITESRRVHTVNAIVVLVSQVAWAAYQLRDLEWSRGL